MSRVNCWQSMKCGRETGGLRAHEMGVCPASTDTRFDGVNGGTNGGRACWAVAGTLCKGEVQGTMAVKLGSCLRCDFFQSVRRGEPGFVLEP